MSSSKARGRRTSPSRSAGRTASRFRNRALPRRSPTKRPWASFCPTGSSHVSSRSLVFIVPIVVILVFWLMARWETRFVKDASRKSFFERNGKVLGIAFILLVAFWMLFLVVLPYLYMVVESFHPRLPPTAR